jgi:hypothetical protein
LLQQSLFWMPVMHAPPFLTQQRPLTQLDLKQQSASATQPLEPTPTHEVHVPDMHTPEQHSSPAETGWLVLTCLRHWMPSGRQHLVVVVLHLAPGQQSSSWAHFVSGTGMQGRQPFTLPMVTQCSAQHSRSDLHCVVLLQGGWV